ncbi:elongation factor G [Paucibacter sp. DJ2R-2]|uniref:elongation factor G n=1 Tax=Paucibacter sp. DJ2R-2 TaxID=2893558 RepID=UPI0021E508CB|nr:elongation factor G [Paucibacter sp. DJ2R-2]MCV2423613.1 elongation factor G [Paucibacter sp. DJ4R-1]MCV2441464.1 elongation factor G [Paucibacter sp. DJ2R-2]
MSQSPNSDASRAPSSTGAPLSPAVATLRSLALVGPAAAGKTSLLEALLLQAGAIAQAGTVERGNTVSDFDPLERRLQHSLHSSVVHLEHGGVRIHAIDTPGAADFIGQSLPALEAVDTAVLVLNAQSGLEPMASKMMETAAQRGLCRLIVINKIDLAELDLPDLLAQIRTVFGRECLPLNLPAEGGRRVLDCFYNIIGQADFSSVGQAHQALVEQVVEVDAAFVDRYLSEGDVDPRELHAPLEQALREGHLIPVCFTSARSGAGVAELLDVIERLLPNPAEGNPPLFLRGEGPEALPLQALPEPSAHVLAHVFKIISDPYLGKMGVMRVHQGTLRRHSQLFIGSARKPFRVGHLFLLQGGRHVEVEQALPGELCAIAKVDDLHYDAVLHDAPEDAHIHLSPLDFPVPVHGLAINPVRHGDEQKLWEQLSRLVEEDPCLRLDQAGQTQETVIYGLGELHLRLLLERLRESYKFELHTQPPRVAYRETISAAAEGHYRHKKQSGGAGQFGEVYLRVEPLARGAGFEFVDAVKGGTIPGQFMPAVEKGVRSALDTGVVAGYPLVDLRVTVFDGKHHSVDSKEVAFVTAGRRALIAAVQEARPLVLEPVVHLEVHAPEAAIGDITGDLAARRGQVNGTDSPLPGRSVVRGLAPLAELSQYQSRLNALSSGQGRYSVQLSHYEAVPPHTQSQLIAAYQAQEED